MTKSLVLLALAIVVTLGSGCSRASRSAPISQSQIDLTAIPFPAAVGDSRLVIKITDDAGLAVNDAVLSVKADMTHAGMVPVLAEIQGGGEDGFYDVPFEWTMAGDWVVTVEALLGDGSRVKQRFDISVLTKDESVCTHDDPEG